MLKRTFLKVFLSAVIGFQVWGLNKASYHFGRASVYEQKARTFDMCMNGPEKVRASGSARDFSEHHVKDVSRDTYLAECEINESENFLNAATLVGLPQLLTRK